MHEAKRPTDLGKIIYTKNSFLKHDNSRATVSDPNLLFSKRDELGMLTIATGMGLTDPVHEHDGMFEGIVCRNSAGDIKNLKDPGAAALKTISNIGNAGQDL